MHPWTKLRLKPALANGAQWGQFKWHLSFVSIQRRAKTENLIKKKDEGMHDLADNGPFEIEAFFFRGALGIFLLVLKTARQSRWFNFNKRIKTWKREREGGWPKSSIGKGLSQSLGMEETGSQKHFFHVFFSDNGSLCTVNSSCSVENASIFFLPTFSELWEYCPKKKKKRKKNFELGNYIHTVNFTFHTHFFIAPTIQISN